MWHVFQIYPSQAESKNRAPVRLLVISNSVWGFLGTERFVCRYLPTNKTSSLCPPRLCGEIVVRSRILWFFARHYPEGPSPVFNPARAVFYIADFLVHILLKHTNPHHPVNPVKTYKSFAFPSATTQKVPALSSIQLARCCNMQPI
jgi:hypothetical protein